ncbi:hypothetical protein HETIRDRAFT_317109 [Heterobasidion irregulare TC 32-1]|uniref:Uncharacterized protein n=1 Tax=Heterobasidion irregulare (strain TC 32-1) TaxID=747525 RepID=W4KA35_HETIT|nr:uncharacterized protein HETIRDRAFT_317109 [Heterobasidion irregulare TC 32-1]ETW82210.1 hypothetical protein HETIRDRAFT_317109 [Heterobasidion irregulare TC 32-1]
MWILLHYRPLNCNSPGFSLLSQRPARTLPMKMRICRQISWKYTEPFLLLLLCALGLLSRYVTPV